MDKLVFKSRNKEYGAYLLRKMYFKHLVTGFSVAFIWVLFTLECLRNVEMPVPQNIGKVQKKTEIQPKKQNRIISCPFPDAVPYREDEAPQVYAITRISPPPPLSSCIKFYPPEPAPQGRGKASRDRKSCKRTLHKTP
jgi:protein TonB